MTPLSLRIDAAWIRTAPAESLEALTAAARQLQAAGDADDLVRRIVDMAVATIDGCRYAGVARRGGRLS
jgi:hypothetical protein